jgi:anti-anti-sigma factor
MIGPGPHPIGRSPRFRDHNGCRLLRLTGELDISVRDATERDLREHVGAVGSSVIIVDLSAVSFIDTAGLDPLLRAHAELAERDRVLALSAISGPVQRLLRLLAGMSPNGLVTQTVRAHLTPLYVTPEADDLGEQPPPGLGRQARDLQAAMHDHAVLNEAIGLLMALHDCNAEQARLLLELVSSRRGISIADLATGIVAATEATGTWAAPVGPAAMVRAGVRAALSTGKPSSRTAS